MCISAGVQGSLKYWVGKLECGGDVEKQWFYKQKFIKRLRESEIAIETEKANEQHYEVPTEYFTTVSTVNHYLVVNIDSYVFESTVTTR